MQEMSGNAEVSHLKPWAPTHITDLVEEREQLDTEVKEKFQQGVVFPPAAPDPLLKI